MRKIPKSLADLLESEEIELDEKKEAAGLKDYYLLNLDYYPQVTGKQL